MSDSSARVKVMTAHSDAVSTAHRLQEITERMMVPNRHLEALTKTLVRQTEMFQAPALLSKQSIQNVQRMTQSMTPSFDRALKLVSDSQAIAAKNALAALSPKLPLIVSSYPTIAESFARQDDALKAVAARIAEWVPRPIVLPVVDIAPLMGPVREAAQRAAAELHEVPEVAGFVESIGEAEQSVVDEGQAAEPATGSNPTLVVAVYLGLIFAFLANQRGVV